VDVLDLMRAFLALGYGSTNSKIDKKIQEYREGRLKDEEERDLFLKMRQRFYSFKNSLKRDGLIDEDDNGKVKLKGRGSFKLKDLNRRKKSNIPVREYKAEPSDKLIVIIFDIPEEKRRKRAWLRATLKNLGFEIEQQSVWIGKTKISKTLLDDLDKFGLLEYIQIFEATKLGSLYRYQKH
jgi:Fe-S oxidoreductase